MKLYEALAEAFVAENTSDCFALLGDANMHWAGAMSERGVNFVYTRHEHAAVAGAVAYARSSGRVGVASVTCGPGLTQCMTILPIAVRAKIPLIIFAGEAPLSNPWYNQKIDHAPFVEACGGKYFALHQPSTMVQDIHNAFATAQTESVPVVVGVPFDIQKEEYNQTTKPTLSVDMRPSCELIKPDLNLIQLAAEMISQSHRPILLAGLGASHSNAKETCISLAKKVGALLATTLPAKGFFHDQDFNLGVSGGYSAERAREIFKQADLVIAVGSRLASHAFDGGKLMPDAKVIHIDIEPNEMVQGRKAADLLLKSDAKQGVAALNDVVSPQIAWRTPEMREVTRYAIEIPNERETPDNAHHPMGVIRKLASVIPPECHVINTSGHCAYYTAQMNKHPHDRYTVIRDFGAIGNGTSFALGIATAFPKRPVVLLDGDGSALMHIQELETIVRHNLHVLMVTLNDGAYGSEVHKLRPYGLPLEGSVFGRSDFASIGKGFSMAGRCIDNLDDIQSAMDDFLTSKKPAIWDIPISDKIASPKIQQMHRGTGT